MGQASTTLQSLNQASGITGISTPADLINLAFPALFSIAGLILLAMLIYGGFLMLTSGATPDNAEKGKQTITNALIGFLLLFTSFWIAQIVQVVSGVKFL